MSEGGEKMKKFKFDFTAKLQELLKESDKVMYEEVDFENMSQDEIMRKILEVNNKHILYIITCMFIDYNEKLTKYLSDKN